MEDGGRRTSCARVRTGCMVDGCRGKDAGILFRLNYSIPQHGGGCIIRHEV